MRTSFRGSFIAFAIAMALPTLAQDKGRDILLEMRDSLLAHNTMSYTVDLRIKFPFASDTSTITEKVWLKRDPTDTLFGGNVMLTTGKELMNLYDGKHIHECNTRTDSCVRYTVAKGETWNMTAGQQGVLWLRDMTQPERITKRCAIENDIEWLGDTVIAGAACGRIRVRFPDNAQIKDHEVLYTISRHDRVVRDREERYLTEGEILWYRWSISDVEFDAPGPDRWSISTLMPTAVSTDYKRPERPKLLAIGEAAPLLIGDLLGTGPEADTIHYEGRVTFVDFWAIGCAPCRHSMPVIDSLHRVYAGRDVQFIGANPFDTVAKLQTFFEKRDLHYPTLVMERDSQKAFNVQAIPVFYLVDASGRVAASWEGYGRGTEREWLAKIDELLEQ
jgi:thiol-disulfide isomerase/thioredoxin